MDDSAIDRIGRTIRALATRRSALGLVTGLGLSALPGLPEVAAGKGKGKGKKKKHHHHHHPPTPRCDTREWLPQSTFGSFGSEANQFNGSDGVAVAPDGQTAWVVDSGNHRVAVWTKSGSTWSNQSTFGSFGTGANQFSSPFGVAVAPDGQTVWVADTLNNRVAVWAKSGDVWSNQTTFGSEGTGPDQFSIPRAVALAPDGQAVWVADHINNRVSIWEDRCTTPRAKRRRKTRS